MLFNVEHDHGDRIVGYLVPDTFNGRGRLVIRSGGIDLLNLETFEPREALVAAKRHETGICGFSLTEDNLPGLSRFEDLEILEAQTGIVIYRRYRPEAIVHSKIFRLETHLAPLTRLDRAIADRFQFHFVGIERHGLETTNQMLLMNNTSSVFASGRLAYKSVEYYVDQGYSSVIMLHDPYDELAERLLVLRLIAQGKELDLGARDNLALQAAADFARDLPIDDERALGRHFRHLEPGTISVIADPLVRQLTKRLSDEAITPSDISGALSILSNFAVVGIRTRADLFAEDLAYRLAIPAGEIPVIAISPTVQELGQRLRAHSSVERILEHDLALFHEVGRAFKKSLASH